MNNINKFDEFNIDFLKKSENVDALNKQFYGKFQYPWMPTLLQVLPGSGLHGILNNDIGYFNESRIPENSRIWVAGCGTNQALITAIKYPKAQVMGTDLSTQSLAVCQKNSEALHVENLTLIESSINNSNFIDEFDYIICTGVIHHNASPEFALEKLSKALKKDGIIELMVYNYYHRILAVSTQKTIMAFSNQSDDLSLRLEIAKKIISKYPINNIVSDSLQYFKSVPDAQLADAFCQPIEYSYTVDSLDGLVNTCGLEYLQPCNNQFDLSKFWNTHFNDEDLDNYYCKLPDKERWQITNLLLAVDSPMLWFYLQKKDSKYKRRTQAETCEEFLNTRFERFEITVSDYVLNQMADRYDLSGRSFFPHKVKIADKLSKRVYDEIDGSLTIKSVLSRLNIEPNFYNLSILKNNLTSVAAPYLKSRI